MSRLTSRHKKKNPLKMTLLTNAFKTVKQDWANLNIYRPKPIDIQSLSVFLRQCVAVKFIFCVFYTRLLIILYVYCIFVLSAKMRSYQRP